MAEIPALQAAQRFALQNESRQVRLRQEEARLRLEALRQGAREVRNAAFEDEVAAKQVRIDHVRQDVRAAADAAALRRADQTVREDEVAGQRRLIVEQDFFHRQARVADADARDRFFVLSRQGLDRPLEPFAPPPGPLNQAFASEAAPRPVEGPAAPPPPPAEIGPSDFAIVQQERELRLAERRLAERDAAIQLELDLQLAQDRIEQVAPNPELPRGSIVDVVG